MLRGEEIGGGRVKQTFRLGDRYVKRGEELTREQIVSMPYANRVALIGRFIEVWPMHGDGKPAVTKDRKISRIAVHIGSGKYNVFEGYKVNTAPLDREDATTLASSTR